MYVNNDRSEQEAIKAIVNHLTTRGGDYPSLLRYLDWYGRTFLLDNIVDNLRLIQLKLNRVVDIGAGLGWLGIGLAEKFTIPYLLVDKRQYMGIDIVANIESNNGIARIMDEISPKDTIVMSEVLHCLSDPKRVMGKLRDFTIIAIEYYPSEDFPEREEYMLSYWKQTGSLDCTRIENLDEVFLYHNLYIHDMHPYRMIVARPK